jgi:hypothetical protein
MQRAFAICMLGIAMALADPNPTVSLARRGSKCELL